MGHRDAAPGLYEELRGDCMISARVNVVEHWGEKFALRVNAEVGVALTAAAEVGAHVASEASMSRKRTGRMAKMDVLETVGTPIGWAGGFRSEAFYAGFQSDGTLGSRRRKVSAATERRRASASGQARATRSGSNRGIKPLGFLEKGRTAAKLELLERLNRL